MNRSRRYNPSNNKPFVSGGVYDGQQQYNQQQQQYQQHQSQSQQQQSSSQQYQVQYQNANNNQQNTYDQQQQAVQQQKPQQQQAVQQQKPQQQQKAVQEKQSQPAVSNDDNVDMQIGETGGSEDGKSLFKKLFANRKKSSVRSREKKIRQNRRLRKAITPKNALMALNEVKGIQMTEFSVNSSQTGGFVATVSINNSQYEGRGHSKAAAKNNACEKALRDYVISKMITNPRLSKSASDNNINAMDTSENGTEETKTDATNEDEDDVPMVNLASFALYKLFSEWESEGFVIPEMHRTAQNAAETNGAAPASEPKKPPTIRTELPANWETMHPSTLLCMMRPGLVYQSLGTTGEKPNETQNVSIVVDENEFKGCGRSKKNARRNAAVAACNTLFGTNFVLEGTV